MSILRVDNFGPSAGGTTYSARGIAKAWVNFNGQGTIAARDSENVSSLTDNATGGYTVNFSNAFDTADYAKVGTASSDGTAVTIISETGTGTTLAGSVNIISRVTNTAGARDPEINNFAAFGDLA